MKLTSAHVTKFKSIDDSNSVPVDNSVTVLVGQNESGKTAFLQALHKAHSVESGIAYDVIIDYPRKDFTLYEAQHPTNPALVVKLSYELDLNEIEAINEDLGFKVLKSLSVTIHHNYANKQKTFMTVPEIDFVNHILSTTKLSSDTSKLVGKPKSLNELITKLQSLDLNSEENNFLTSLVDRFGSPSEQMLANFIYKNFIQENVPKFLYFDDYYLLPDKVNLADLQQKVTAAEKNNQPLEPEDKTVLGLLHIAGVDLKNLSDTTGYEYIKARLETINNSVTDKLFKYWTTNTDLEVEFDIRADPKEQPPFNNGSNLYIRIRNRRHRVTVPFSQRSRGFIWFFSFIVWFDSIKKQLKTDETLILLLDEPGLNLHAAAQQDLLTYLDDLAVQHQLIYTTHSPFMVHSDRLQQVRTVEDKRNEGTKVSDRLDSADERTLFPLQAALGYTIAQNLFISKKNLLVEGPADLIYLQYFSSVLEGLSRTSLRSDITIVPTGGLDNVVTFISLFGANKLDIAVLHDYESRPNQRLEQAVKDKLIKAKQIVNFAMFRTPDEIPPSNLVSSDIEDMFSANLYLELFNATFKSDLQKPIKEKDLPAGDRIVNRIERYLEANKIQLRPSKGFNHYLVASYLASHPIEPKKLDDDTLARFEQVITAINNLLK